MNFREIKDFARAAIGIQAATGVTMPQAKAEVARRFEVEIPDDDEFAKALIAPPALRKRGRPPNDRLTKRDAVAAVAVYFESVGAGREQAIDEAKRWLDITLSRRVAKEAVSVFKARNTPDQFKIQAQWAYASFRPRSTIRLPAMIAKVRKRRV